MGPIGGSPLDHLRGANGSDEGAATDKLHEIPPSFRGDLPRGGREAESTVALCNRALDLMHLFRRHFIEW